MELQHLIDGLRSDGEKDFLVMRHDGSMTGDVASIAHMHNIRKNVDLGELVLGKILLPKANQIIMVEVSVPTLAMYFEQGL